MPDVFLLHISFFCDYFYCIYQAVRFARLKQVVYSKEGPSVHGGHYFTSLYVHDLSKYIKIPLMI